MNILLSLKCESCDALISCRVGMSNRPEQKVGFACPVCSAPIDIEPLENKKVSGAIDLSHETSFDPKANFVDLHLDFPVSFGAYVQGHTPFMMASRRVGIEETRIHGSRLHHIDSTQHLYKSVDLMIKHYKRAKWTPFKGVLEKKFQTEMQGEKMEDKVSSLFSALGFLIGPYLRPNQSSEDINHYMAISGMAHSNAPEATEKFIDELFDTGYVTQLHFDILDIYPKILNAEPHPRAALLLDFDEIYEEKVSPMRASSGDFDSYKDLYKDIAELLSRLMVIVASMNNLLKRQDHNAFLDGEWVNRAGKDLKPKNMNDYADLDFGRKWQFIDDSWFEFVDDVADNQLRNAIAHVKTEYDDISQILTYYPRREGLNRDKPEQMYLLDFLRRILLSFRELNRLHQFVKSIIFFRLLIQKKSF